MAKNEPNPREFELYILKNSETKLYWDGKGFNEKKREKAILAEYRLTKALMWEYKFVEAKLVLADWRNDKSWEHLIPKTKCSLSDI